MAFEIELDETPSTNEETNNREILGKYFPGF